ncbi:hypothetical protein EB796_003259 [Bugula neritina]|uniref:Uncharacterized protein n=1 Tax=Bugula neritina TaxID=10212 RepID=A0A7J7KJJ4_BUGNE|nr:hypothetical protein EB796_003259 [Bugula neritina]
MSNTNTHLPPQRLKKHLMFLLRQSLSPVQLLGPLGRQPTTTTLIAPCDCHFINLISALHTGMKASVKLKEEELLLISITSHKVLVNKYWDVYTGYHGNVKLYSLSLLT